MNYYIVLASVALCMPCAHAASIKGFKASTKPATATTATTHAATMALVTTNQEVADEHFDQLSRLKKIEVAKKTEKKQYPTRTSSVYQFLECLENTIHLGRGILHHHPHLWSYHARTELSALTPQHSCAVARLVVGNLLDTGRIADVQQTLKEQPLQRPAGCDGTTCRGLIDSAKKYLDMHCDVCDNSHALNEYCVCPCKLLDNKGTKNLQHTHTECPHHGKKARLYVDELVADDVAQRKKAQKQQQQEKHEEFLTQAWMNDTEALIREIDAKKAAAGVNFMDFFGKNQ